MKLFGSNQRNNQELEKTMQFPIVKQNQPLRSAQQGTGVRSTQGIKKKKKKQGKMPLTRRQRVRRTIILLMLLLAVGLGAAAFYMTTVHAPSIAANTWGNTAAQDSGDRISDYFTFVVGAVDTEGTRTDNLMVVGFDTKNKKINIMNIPRDTRTNSDRNGASNKINAAYGTKGGIETLKSDIRDLLGFTPDYYMIVNLQGMADIVDAIGGVDYNIPFRMYYKDPSQDLSIDFKPGMTHLNGEQTVEFLRWRKNNGGVSTGDPNYTGSDEQRIAKEQEFLRYLASQVLSPTNATKIPSVAKAVFANVKTDFTNGEMLWMGMQAVGLDKNNLQMFTLPGEPAYAYCGTSDRLSFFFPDEEKTLALVNENFNPYQQALTDLNIVSRSEETASSGSDSTSSTTTRHKKRTSTKKTQDSTQASTSTDSSSTDSTSGSTDTTQSGSSDKSSSGSTDTASSGSDSSSGTKQSADNSTSTTPAAGGGTSSSSNDPEA